MHFRILKMIATCGFLGALECTKFVFGAAGAYSAPQTPSLFNRVLFLRGGEGKEGMEKEGKKSRSIPPAIPAYAPDRSYFVAADYCVHDAAWMCRVRRSLYQ